MKYRLVDDVHLEFGNNYYLPKIEGEEEMILILAGDIAPVIDFKHLLKPFLNNCCKRHKFVIWVWGNHEYYHEHIDCQKKYIDMLGKIYPNLVILENDVFILNKEKTVIIGATLWTDFDKESPFLMFEAKRMMSDYRVIQGITPNLILKRFEYSSSYIDHMIKQWKGNDYKTIVVTHHAPLWNSVGIGFETANNNGYFVSDLEDMILDRSPDVWCHGHVHCAHDYMAGDTRILCNPRGYHDIHENTYGYDDTLVFEL